MIYDSVYLGAYLGLAFFRMYLERQPEWPASGSLLQFRVAPGETQEAPIEPPRLAWGKAHKQ